MLISKYGFTYSKSKKLLRKKVSELANSNYFVHVKCDECEKPYKTLWTNRNIRIKIGRKDLCQSCSRSGERNSQFGKDRRELLKYVRGHVKNFGRAFTQETKQKMSNTRSSLIAQGKIDINSNNRGNKNWYKSTKSSKIYHADSSLELLRMIQLDADENVVSWTKRHGIQIPYEYNGNTKNCIPDFLIHTKQAGVIIEEVKGRVTEVEIIKKNAIRNYCIKNGYSFRFITQKEIDKNGEYRNFLKTKNM